MRNGQNKRMRGRNRNKSHHHGGGGGHHHNPLTRIHESNGPDVKIRGTAHHIAEKYLQLARDAQGSGDPVTAENYFQHAEHYFRLIAAAQEQFRAQNPYYQAPPAPGATADDAFEGDDEDAQPGQGQPQNAGGPPQNFNSPQPPYPPREQPQPYGGPQPGYQGRAQQQSSPQPYNPQPYHQQPAAESEDAGRLPSFITGAQPQQQQQQQAQGFSQNGGYDNAGGGGERFPRHRRRRHRGPGGPRPETQQDFHGDEPEAPGNG